MPIPAIAPILIKVFGPVLVEKGAALFKSRYAPLAFACIAFFLGAAVGYYYCGLRADRAALKAVDDALAKAEKQYEIDVAIAVEAAKNEREIEYVYRNIEKKIYIEADDCNDLGADWAGVYLESIRAAKAQPSN